jgi:hypothetical protein
METDPEVLCINCEEFISVNFLEQHSATCVHVNLKVVIADNGSGLSRSQLRLERLQVHIARQMQTSANPGDSSYFKILHKLCAQLQGVRSLLQVGVNDQASESLASLIVTYRGSPSALLCAERLKSLAAMQKGELADLKLEESKQQVSEMQAQIEFYRARAESLEQALTNVAPESGDCAYELDEVRSETSSYKSGGFESTERSSTTGEDGSSPMNEVEDILVDQADRKSPLDNLQRYFYSQCLAIKLTFPAKASAHLVSISALYESAKQKQIPMARWPDFIKESMQVGGKEAKAKRKSNFRSAFRHRMNYCETIAEEEEL